MSGFYRASNKRLIARGAGGRFRKTTFADVGIGRCQCGTLFVPEYDDLGDMPSPQAFNVRNATCPACGGYAGALRAAKEAKRFQIDSEWQMDKQPGLFLRALIAEDEDPSDQVCVCVPDLDGSPCLLIVGPDDEYNRSLAAELRDIMASLVDGANLTVETRSLNVAAERRMAVADRQTGMALIIVVADNAGFSRHKHGGSIVGWLLRQEQVVSWMRKQVPEVA